MDLKSLLEFYGLDTNNSKIKIARHKDEKRGYDLPLLYRINQFDIYQSYQEDKDFHGCDYLISFLGINNSQAVFIGIYKVKSIKRASEVPLPIDFYYYDIYKPNRNYFYELEELSGFEDLKDRLIINWSGGAINWIQWLDTRNKEVVQILPKGYVSHFPGYSNFILTYEELKKIINNPDAHKEWHNMLAAISGIYVIVDTSNGKQYIGSASGNEGVLGRFKEYAKSPDGGNIELQKLIENDPMKVKFLHYTLLETLPRTLPRKEVLAREELYKQKLGSRKHGYNLN
ncbi:excinuclease ABC subunit C [Bacillus sp. AFS077874]|uniref:GIY-YIG nuclease family protein n=1 Tax=unclassified Bacillus (in: firmicutes) TaxID=185979 RepID=UPI000BED5636|nr:MULTISPECIES: GIY-YIG nuclease family protein [unclassified Bacillus (in: firmicutes)]PEC51055.1 excinuclease ABC subunit C [Bacillus sp. AFS096315]PFM81222.1 excinuclease ABC subunit C [Bacillus sp. AFS077874]PGM56989.1 excinuclease ABC subunit C [Bacillus sp. AFS053548]